MRKEYTFAFVCATRGGHLEIVIWLKEQGLTTDEIISYCNNLFRLVYRHCNLDILNYLGLTIDDTQSNDNSIIKLDSCNGHKNIV